MAISFLGSVSAAAVNGGDPTLDLTALATPLEAGDVVIVAYAIGQDNNTDFDMVVSSPTDYNELADLHADDTQDVDLGVFYKVQGETPDTAVVLGGGGGMDDGVAAVAMAFRGVDQTTPMDVTATTATGVSSNIPNPPSIDHNNPAGVWTVAVGAFGHTGGATVTLAAPADYDDVIDESGNDADDVTVAMAYRPDPGDPENPGTFTPSIADSTAHSWCAVTIALRPGAVAPTAKSATDSSTLVESVSLLRASSVVDTGTLAEAHAVLELESKSATDSATLAESLMVAQQVAKTATDTGTLAETVSLAPAVNVSDVGTLAESVEVDATVSVSDTGSLAEAQSIVADVEVIDAGALAEINALLASLPIADSGTLGETVEQSEAGSEPEAKAASDSASLAEALVFAGVVGAADSGTLAEAYAIAGTVDGVEDTGTLAESLSVSEIVPGGGTGTTAGSGRTRTQVNKGTMTTDKASGRTITEII